MYGGTDQGKVGAGAGARVGVEVGKNINVVDLVPDAPLRYR